ncbi:VOC family protein [Alginatibacterium sediminis]|uniref:VOC family protein n=1 Tax=Alginatibacterium sediminis TaxID=2164068 RepID=A0A420EHH1_9ALTE|nr:VOC family protein [Alginatibacterium sediminis]RKF20110.1 VOC family protein [Alginatibacterium sediminis]
MIGYTTVGTNQFENALGFYDALMAVFGEQRLWQTQTMAAWGASRNDPAFCIVTPHDTNNASVGNGVMIALKASSHLQVNLAYKTALSLGGSCEGKPGPRGTNGFYGAYFRDLDGNKLNAYCPASKA